MDKTHQVAAIVDPIEPEKCLQAAQDNQVKITTILTTHSHWDHAGGNNKMKEMLLQQKHVDKVPVYGGIGDGVQGCTHEVDDMDTISLGDLKIVVRFTPCHTAGHVLYHCQDNLFTGDTLFVGGCGRLNEGSPEKMHYALNEVIAQMDGNTNVYVGHEYTVKNLEFALTVEPNNQAVLNKLNWAKSQRSKGLPTVPSTINSELETNPFMRVSQPGVMAYSGVKDPVDVLRIVRQRKDEF